MTAGDAIIELREMLYKYTEEYAKFQLPETERKIKAVKFAIRCITDTYAK